MIFAETSLPASAVADPLAPSRLKPKQVAIKSLAVEIFELWVRLDGELLLPDLLGAVRDERKSVRRD